ncbi:hypothetical protein COY52_07260 [Candidatus Desantisbacteria bacterium CG_4_10_14_0_8_um_filter_48_22]|uniref:Uncharacterized protein n=1 Tax=Candidatus Desantisbacteria bacterium CG_4_10_14_0_8_um_filter_48_22 TaxID=1974543 RepID=A0A2M7SA44_9BACT|nr:MAG: hypothetical protein AUJ67_07295 [Candidatus Desantisbacteria bacterium CG1_02_49_89]PIV54222.1 MAG: hypothetical protein COS16_11425 [Candidatus Desantisbacteria bacterium CG02_land_8_20_14_3_00_49_13]PIZ16339.1 MAG: hypothetical protein COY52_07260 [Candidatus Desantisbacteria bacterium CG_4_10_14_0_8_um_filter_48_22]PJB27157.1 MAG: hypothetical protein CO111_06835 [Candidatus Desantisbacteria bacterium CG_4_9_14_3_um_filter_50_7]
MCMADLDRRVKKLNLLDEKLSQAAVTFLCIALIKAFPSILGVGLEWTIPLCALFAVISLYIYWAKEGRVNPETGRQYDRRIQRFTFSDLMNAHFAFIFGLLILIRIIPQALLLRTRWLALLFVCLGAKPFYVFWIKKEAPQKADA